ncbi:MAG: hypothetical protein OEW12_03595, partial [Deltaproteobacteria bacterium]|nr:hypothetical protein [Deltaproteobacteria bacterium]
MANSSEWNNLVQLLDDIPAETIRGPGNSLLLVMEGLGASPSNFRLLRGLTPWLDTQEAGHVFLLTRRRRREPWRKQSDLVEYHELIHWDPSRGIYRGTCWKGEPIPQDELAQAFKIEPLGLVEYAARRVRAAVVSNAEPMRLAIHHVEKPWGREGWYTGIENRGVSHVESATGKSELPYVLGMFPEPIIGESTAQPILIKILEPNPVKGLGDLYLEVHTEKWESYIVMGVDKKAWPGGVGYLRAGLDKNTIGRFRRTHGEKWEKPLVVELKAKIGAYEKIRRAIDALNPDSMPLDSGPREVFAKGSGSPPSVGLVAPPSGKSVSSPSEGHGAAPPSVGGGLSSPAGGGVGVPPPGDGKSKPKSEVPRELLEQELHLRQEVESFLGMIPLKEGDVATLPAGVLHSLLHGVKVIEFQTPTYERLIAMFGQEVKTQPHWDTDKALDIMRKEPYTPGPPELLESAPGIKRERVVDFPEFIVDRLTLKAGQSKGGR